MFGAADDDLLVIDDLEPPELPLQATLGNERLVGEALLAVSVVSNRVFHSLLAQTGDKHGFLLRC